MKPYYSKFYGNAKGRWMGRTVLDVCVSEFAANPPAYYEEAIKNGMCALYMYACPCVLNYLIDCILLIGCSVFR